jgi:PAS domain S-box-containing protein
MVRQSDNSRLIDSARGASEMPSHEIYSKLYAMLVDAIPSSMLLVDREFRILSTNRNFLDRSRRSSADTLGRKLHDVFPPGILDNTNILFRIQQAFSTNVSSHGERITYRAPGLPMRFYYYRIVPFMWEGSVESVLLLLDDVTEQVLLSEEVRRVERHLASVVESARDIVLSVTIDGRILTWNTAAEQLSGYSLEEVRDRHFIEYCASQHRAEVEAAFEMLKAGRSIRSQMGEWHLITRTGTALPVSWVCSPMRTDGGETTGIVAVGRDLTEYRKLEMQLVQSQKLAALGVMAGGIAHEIRNPLAICYSAAQFLMEDDITDEFRRECVEDIRTGINKTSIIIENLLSFARPTTRTDLIPIDLVPVIEETLQLIINQAKVQGIALHWDIPPSPVLVKGIANLIQQVLINILLNAINAMPDGGTLKLRLEQDARDIRIRVTDTGCGIPESDIDKIFDPFYTTSAAGKGTGLGLSICYSIVKEHGGKIDVQSSLNGGSEFTVCLPRLDAAGYMSSSK